MRDYTIAVRLGKVTLLLRRAYFNSSLRLQNYAERKRV
jgi:hypothetical protein